MKKRVIFLERDGTLIAEPPHDYQVDSFEKLHFLPGVLRNLYILQQELDVEWAMITNQDGLGTDEFPEHSFWGPHNKMLDVFASEGITFKEIFIDRSFKHENSPNRKPGTGMLGKYLNGDYDLAHSFVIGDRPSDIELAKNLGGRGILIGRSSDDKDDGYEMGEALALESHSWDEICSFLLAEMKGRKAFVERKTQETQVKVRVDLDGNGSMNINTGIGFLDHMLDQVARHANIDLEIEVLGDLHIDEHHTIEDTALAMGEAFKKALGEKRGIERYGSCNLPMDEALSRVAIDFSGRPYMVFDVKFDRERVGDMPTEMVRHFFKSFSDTSAATLHIETRGSNAHHMIEASFKSFARAIREAIRRDGKGNDIPSTKGVL